MDARDSERDEGRVGALMDDVAEALTAEEERGIVEAMASLDAGGELPFEDVFRELEDLGDS